MRMMRSAARNVMQLSNGLLFAALSYAGLPPAGRCADVADFRRRCRLKGAFRVGRFYKNGAKTIYKGNLDISVCFVNLVGHMGFVTLYQNRMAEDPV